MHGLSILVGSGRRGDNCCKLIEHFRAQLSALHNTYIYMHRTLNVPFSTMFVYFPGYTGEHWVFPHPTPRHLMRTEVISSMAMTCTSTVTCSLVQRNCTVHVHVHPLDRLPSYVRDLVRLLVVACLLFSGDIHILGY